MEDNAKVMVNDFREKKALYEEFCLVMHKLLESMLISDNYRYQIFYRIKEYEKLQEKILRKAKEGKIYKKLEDIEDLAGLRVLFYIEADKEKFEEKILSEIKGEVNVTHHKKLSGYEATHLIASFGEARLRLIEYKKFEGLKCEIQLTSVLHHAWAEIEHDMIYKDNIGIKRDGKQDIFIKKAMRNILKKYLSKATSGLDELAKKFKK